MYRHQMRVALLPSGTWDIAVKTGLFIGGPLAVFVAVGRFLMWHRVRGFIEAVALLLTGTINWLFNWGWFFFLLGGGVGFGEGGK